MKRTARSVRSAAAGILVMAVAAALASATSYAQSPSGSEKGAYGGGSASVHFETAKGGGGEAVVGSAIIGYRFNARWAIQGELGRMGNIYCHESFVSPDRKMTDCRSDPIFSFDAVRRFTAGSLRPYVVFGLGMDFHAGAGVEVNSIVFC